MSCKYYQAHNKYTAKSLMIIHLKVDLIIDFNENHKMEFGSLSLLLLHICTAIDSINIIRFD